VDSAGNVYATAPSSKTVIEYDSTGNVLGTKGSNIELPTGIWADPDGTLYVVDTTASKVVKIEK
jgi:DNA-binding beta-propeller fold protein YncE